MEQALEQVRVLDLVLQLVEHLDLAVNQRLHPPGQVDQDLDPLLVRTPAVDLARDPQHPLDRLVLPLLDIAGEHAERVAARDADGRRCDRRQLLAAHRPLDHLLQLGLAALRDFPGVAQLSLDPPGVVARAATKVTARSSTMPQAATTRSRAKHPHGRVTKQRDQAGHHEAKATAPAGKRLNSTTAAIEYWDGVADRLRSSGCQRTGWLLSWASSGRECGCRRYLP